MWVSGAGSEFFCASAMALLLGWAVPAAGAEAFPARVVSTNLCTDQLALLLAEPGQLVSVSFLAHEARSSAMAVEAAALPANRGGAEEIFLLEPDLVLAGTYTARGSVEILKRLGIRVEELPPATGFDDVRTHLKAVGAWLGQEERAAALIAEFDRDLARLRVARRDRGRAVLYGPGGYTTGAGTLADDILAAAGLTNVAEEAGIPGGGTLSLEKLILLDPDFIVTDLPYPGQSQAEDILAHPALSSLRALERETGSSNASWNCETPYVLDAVRDMARLSGLLP